MEAPRATHPTQNSPASPAALGRRAVLRTAGALALALGTLELVGPAKPRLERLPLDTAGLGLPDIQFDIGPFIAPVQTINGVNVRFGPVFTSFVTARLNRTPTKGDQAVLDNALNTIESSYAFSPSGVFTFVAYGLPYFRRLPGGLTGPLVFQNMPRLASSTGRYVLEEAVPSPTDVSPANPGITKVRFNVPVTIENNDVLLTLRSDDPTVLADVLTWLAGSNSLNGADVPSPAFNSLFHLTSSRVMFQSIGLPRLVADGANLPFANFVNPQSPMWMGFADQQTSGSGPAAICTFAGNASAHITTAVPGDYFDKGSVQHLSHNIQDLTQFFDLDANGNPGSDGTYTERVQYMFRSDPPPSLGNPDQFTDGGGPAFLENTFLGTDDAAKNAQAINTFNNEHRMGHLPALQRSSRAADGTPMHIRMDGPGFDTMDVPDHSLQPKLQFTVFVPSADFFTTMRRNQASLDLTSQFGVAQSDNGLERFITATRRQNFLIPPRRHRAFPLLELT